MSFLKERIASFGYAFKGIRELFIAQPNARIHAVITIFTLLLGFYLKISSTEWILIILSIIIVLSAEAFNTALEYLTDLVSPNYDPLAGKVKDVAAAAVLISAIGAATIGSIIFLPKLFLLVN